NDAGSTGEIAREAEKDCAESAGRIARAAGQFAMDLYVVKPVSVGPQSPGGIRQQVTRNVVSQQLGLDRLLALRRVRVEQLSAQGIDELAKVGKKMRRLLGSILQMTVMAAIVTTLMYWAVGALLALLCFAVLGISFQSFVTFEDTFSVLPGLLVWWTIGFLP